ncbi:3'-5' exoribonuclease [Endozoicomonas gorgoniicola]|uniref:3'-5' exoribonuclease n=1 Tax=Endozoicomonas gorgoniicola TaxID=1234144 RepID=A0ABT3N1P2_9GAMM|nr:3'-5' exonuclease [Endozoicomonas gorgoniicola]MCW7555541.1 3'-5' exoribonuclease [Endozoicomonas gorgoniicola]
MDNLMVDLETMGNGSNAAIIAIGACFFDLDTGEVGHSFYQSIQLDSAVEKGLAMDPATVTWWMSQSNEARAIFKEKGTTLDKALARFIRFARQSHLKVWGNGSSFDNVILRNALNTCGMAIPWNFWNDRDVRTMVELGRSILDFDPKRDMPFEGVRHHALDDAKHQARYVSEIYQRLKSGADSPV